MPAQRLPAWLHRQPERITLSLAQIVLTSVVTAMGAVSVAANYVAVQAESICYLPAFGVAAAATALVGQSIGAGRPDMARKFANLTTVLGFCLVSVTGTILFLGRSASGRNPDAGAGGHRPERPGTAGGSLLRAAVRREHRGHRSASGAGDSRGPIPSEPLQYVGRAGGDHPPLHPRLWPHGVWGTMTAELVFRGLIFLVRLLRGRWVNAAALS